MTKEIKEQVVEEVKSEKEILEEAQKIIQKDQELVQLCNEELTAILKKYNCTLDVKMIIGIGSIESLLQVVPIKDKEVK